MRQTQAPHSLFPVLFSALVLLAFAACSGGDPDKPPAPPEIYQVRGLIRHLPDADKPVQEILIHHEAVPTFKDDEGHVVGMDAMSMPFTVKDRALIEGLAVGDKIEFELEVAWGGSPGLRLSQIEKLPPATELDFNTRGTTTHDH